jgi:hypothetical protein
MNAADDAISVPAFACIVYISRSDQGVHARVANFADLQQTGADEREVLGKIVPEFKRRIGELMTAGREIPWIDPPSPIEPGEQKRFVPVHL